MAIPRDELQPALTLLKGGMADWRADEARIEAVVFCDEVIGSAEAIIDALTGLPTPSLFAMNEAGKLAHRAALAREQILSLVGPKDAA